MPEYCCVPGCKNRIGGHKFPKEPLLRMKWREAIQRLDKTRPSAVWDPPPGARVCRAHFTEADFNPTLLGERPRLKSGVVPSVFLPPEENGISYPTEGMNGVSSEESPGPAHDQMCCLKEDGRRCRRQAGHASYNKRIQRTVQQRRLKITIDYGAHHTYICNFHRKTFQSLRMVKKRKSGDLDEDFPEIDFCQMPLNTLRRYKRHYKLHTGTGLNKAQLAETVTRHFKTMPVDEKEVLTYFIYSAKNKKKEAEDKSAESMSS